MGSVPAIATSWCQLTGHKTVFFPGQLVHAAGSISWSAY